MKPSLFSLLTAILFSTVAFQATAQENLEDALSISQPEILRPLEAQGFSLADLMNPGQKLGVVDNSVLSKSNFKAILENLKSEINLYQQNNPKAGVGLAFDQRLFDLNYLTHARARFVLVGVINRMDLGYKDPNHCGEIRFIYRLAYNVESQGVNVASRLPITINLLLHQGNSGSQQGCQEIAKRWQTVNANSTAQDITSTGPLNPSVFNPAALKDLEINMQISRMAASERPDFGGHAEYLLKAYEWTGQSFVETTLENQIDRARLQADSSLMNELAAWIAVPQNLKAIDDGTMILPKKFLAKRAISIAPGGINRSGNRLFYGLLPSSATEFIKTQSLQNIKSSTALLRRLNESTCVGCHQTRAIGGFHFTGRDPQGKYAGNSVFLPGSAHFMGDLARRREIIDAFASNKTIDYSRGFAARPQESRSQKLNGTGLMNGWGAHCSTGKDPSFSGWTCAPGLTCKTLLEKEDSLGLGICLAETQQVGDPCEMGKIVTTEFGKDKYTRTSQKLVVTLPNAMCSPQSQAPGTRTGGFLNGNVRTLSCENLPAEASCGPLPAARPGFNSCIGTKNFDACLKEFSMGVGLRACDQFNPCRDDYICAESFESDRGSCVPPYFLFQFRVDGHPKKAVAPISQAK
ncbi:MAG: hypothetical protein J7501_16785 [Bdellovibrio sp.]|nr:hypothetical protein [Bdellovibrio sp.]